MEKVKGIIIMVKKVEMLMVMFLKFISFNMLNIKIFIIISIG